MIIQMRSIIIMIWRYCLQVWSPRKYFIPFSPSFSLWAETPIQVWAAFCYWHAISFFWDEHRTYNPYNTAYNTPFLLVNLMSETKAKRFWTVDSYSLVTEIPFQWNDTQCAVVDNVFPKSEKESILGWFWGKHNYDSVGCRKLTRASHIILYFCRQDQS